MLAECGNRRFEVEDVAKLRNETAAMPTITATTTTTITTIAMISVVLDLAGGGEGGGYHG